MTSLYNHDEKKDTATMTCIMNRNVCRSSLVLYADYIERFKSHAKEINKPSDQLTILLLNIDDIYGRPISKMLLPAYNWTEARRKKEVPFIRALMTKEILHKVLTIIKKEKAEKLRTMSCMTIVVVDYNSIEIFKA